MGDNPDYLDTEKIEDILQNSQSADLGLIKRVNIYHIESISQGCSFELTISEAINTSDRKINLEFIENNSTKNRSANCSIIKNNNKIECNLDENININYIFKNYIEFNNNELFSIISNKENIFPLICSIENNKKSSRLSNILIILIILSAIVLIIIFASFILYKKYIKNNKNKNNKKNKKRIPVIYKAALSNSKTEILN